MYAYIKLLLEIIKKRFFIYTSQREVLSLFYH